MPKPLTAAAAAKFRSGPKRRRIRDGGARSLFLIIEPSGHKSWQMRFRTPSGRIGKLTLGPVHTGDETAGPPVIGMPLTLQGARQLAAEVHRERALGRDVVADHNARKHRQRAEAEQRAATSFGTCVRAFFIEHRVSGGRARDAGAKRPARWAWIIHPTATQRRPSHR